MLWLKEPNCRSEISKSSPFSSQTVTRIKTACGRGDSGFSNIVSHNFRVRDGDDLLSFRRRPQIDGAG
jgi:hypothetical protein